MKILITAAFMLLSTIAYPKDVELSWEKALVFIPGNEQPLAIDSVPLLKPHPVVVYLHGCTGIVDWHDAGWSKALAQEGAIVIVLDSFSRPGRLSNCDPNRKTASNAFPRAHEYRQQEIAYAFEQLQKTPWADTRNLFLMGHSEGGTAVAIYPRPGFRGHIISGWTCTMRGNPMLDGIRSREEIPILAIAANRDEWRVGNRVTEGKCSDRVKPFFFSKGYNLKQVDLDGTTHATLRYPEAPPAVVKFIKELLIN